MIFADRVILIIFAVMFIAGAADYLSGNRFGLGKKFFEGLQTFAPLMLAMAGFIVLTDLLAKLFTPVISPLFTALGADPGLFPGIILACDSGAYPLARELGNSPEAAGFGGMLLGALLGANVTSIPLVIQLVKDEDKDIFFKGLACGIITIPLSLLIGGLAASYPLSFIIRQLPPLVILAVIFAVMLKFVPFFLTKFLRIFAKCMEIVSVTAFSVAVFAELSNINIPGLLPVKDALKIVGSIVIVLPGVYVFTECFKRLLNAPLKTCAHWLRINDTAAAGFIVSTANVIPTLDRKSVV